MTWSTEPAQRTVVIVSMILLHDLINRRVVISLLTYYYITTLRTNTNAMARIEGGNVGIMILFIHQACDIYLPTVV